jgi:hypothetical protein
MRAKVYDVEYRIAPRGRRRTVPGVEVNRRVFVLGDSFAIGCAYSGHREHRDRSIVNASIGRA